VTAKKKTRKQLIDEVVKTACKVTGTQRRDAADRFIVQVGYALVWPKPKDADDHRSSPACRGRSPIPNSRCDDL